MTYYSLLINAIQTHHNMNIFLYATMKGIWLWNHRLFLCPLIVDHNLFEHQQTTAPMLGQDLFLFAATIRQQLWLFFSIK
jgi:hypothetical protein